MAMSPSVVNVAVPAKREAPVDMVMRGKAHYKDAVGRELTAQESQVFAQALIFITKNPGVVSDAIELFQLVDTFIGRSPRMFEGDDLPTHFPRDNHRELIDSYGSPSNSGRALAFSTYQYDGYVNELSDREDLTAYFQSRDPIACMATADTAVRVCTRPLSLSHLETPPKFRRAALR